MRSVLVLSNPINKQTALIAYGVSGKIELYKCSTSCATVGNWVDVGTVATTQSYSTSNVYLPVCAAYEHTSGRLVITYDKTVSETNDLYWKTYDGFTLSSEGALSYVGAGADDPEMRYCDMASNPTASSNELALAIEDATDQDAYAFIWAPSGAGTWGSQRTLTLTMGTTSITGNAVAVGYQTSAGSAVAFSGAGANTCVSERWTGSWTTITCIDPNSVANNDVLDAHAYRDPVSSVNNLMFCQMDDLTDVTCAQIDGATWGAWTSHSTTGDGASTHAPITFAWDAAGSVGYAIYETSGTADTTITYRSWTDSSSTWGTATTLTVASAVHNWFYAATNPTSGDAVDALYLKLNSVFDWGVITRNAASAPTLTGEATLTADTTVVTFEHEGDIVFQASTATPTGAVSPSDTLSASESIARAMSAPRANSDTLSTSESITRAMSAPRAVSDTLSASDSLARTLLASRTFTDSIAVTDSLARTASLFKTMTDSLAISDSLARAVIYSTSLIDSISISDSLATFTTFSRPLADTLAITDSLNTATGFARSLADSISISDSLATVITFGVSLVDTLAISDDLQRAYATSIDLSDSINIVDDILAAGNFSVLLSDAISITDGLATVLDASQFLIDNLVITDGLDRSYSAFTSLADSISVTEDLVVNNVFGRTLVDSIVVTDSLSSSFGAMRSLSDSISISEVLDAFRPGFNVFLEDTLDITDSIQLAGNFSINLVDNLHISDHIRAKIPGTANEVSSLLCYLMGNVFCN